MKKLLLKFVKLWFYLTVFSTWIFYWIANQDSVKIACYEYSLCKSAFLDNYLSDAGAWDLKISMDKFWRVYELLEEKAVEQEKLKDIKHIEDSVIWWLVRSLDDPYSLYMTEKKNEEFKEDLAWNFEWIWAELSMKDELVTVVTPLKDSPAIKAWIQPQDIIIEVDWKTIEGWSLFDVVKIIRGPKWEKVTLWIVRDWESWMIDIDIYRDVIHIDSVNFEMIDDKYANISINQFWDTTITEFYNSVEKAVEQSPEGLVLDLRFNWGWYLESSIIIASPFLEAWDLVTKIDSINWSTFERSIWPD